MKHIKKTYKRKPHSVHLLHAHLSFCTKYRRNVLTKTVFSHILKSIKNSAKNLNIHIDAIESDGNHIHILFNYSPTLTLSKIVQRFKGASSRYIRSLQLPTVLKQLWGRAFFSPSYFIVSCGGAPLDIVKSYVENQQTKQKHPQQLTKNPYIEKE
jgi:putative transposase